MYFKNGNVSVSIAPADGGIRKHTRTALAILLSVAWALWLSSAHLIHGPESYYRQHDTAEGNAAWHIGQAAYASRDLLGDWSPLAGAGVDGRANGRGVQPLFEGIYRLAPYWWTTGVIVALETFAAVLFTVLLLRRIGVSLIPAILAGFAYSMMYDGRGAHSGFFLASGFVVPGFALLLLALMKAATLRTPAAIAAAATAAVLLGVSAGPILPMLALPLVAMWMFLIERGATNRHVAVFVVFALGLCIMAAPTFAAMSQHAADAHRTLWPRVNASATVDAANWAARRVEVESFLQRIAPLLIPAAAAWLLGGFRRRPLNVLVFGSVGIIALVGLMVPLRGILQQIAPPFATFQFDRVTQFLPFLSAAAGAAGLQYFLDIAAHRPQRWLRVVGVVIVTASCTAIAWVLVAQSIQINRDREVLRRDAASYAGMFEQPVLIALSRQMRDEPPARVVTFADSNQVFGGQHPGFSWAHGLETADGYLNLYPLRYHTFWSWVIKPTLERRADIQDYFLGWGNRIYVFNPYTVNPDPINAAHIVNLNLLSLANVRYFVSAVAFQHPDLVPWTGNVGRATSTVQWRPTSTGTRMRELFVYENRRWLPRFFVTTRMRTFAAADELLGALAAASVEDLRHTAFLEGDHGEEAAAPSSAGALPESIVDLRKYSADRIELDVRSPIPGLLVVTNNYSRFWRAYVDDRPSSLLRADFAFQGVHVPAGASRVRLEYGAPYAFPAWQCALAVALLAGVLTGVWGAAGRLRQRRARHDHAREEWSLWPRVTVATVIAATALLVFTRFRTGELPWADDGALYRRAIALLPKGLAAPTDFPVLVQLQADDAGFWDHAPASAVGISFVDGDGGPVAFEIEAYDPSRRVMRAWVGVPALGSVGRTIYMYFGGTPASPQLPSSDVWRPRYVGVWHMSDAPGSAFIRDSTAHANHATVAEGMLSRWQTEGRIAGGAAFNGTSDKLTVPDSDVWTFAADDWTIELWMKPAPLEKRNFGLVQHGPGGVFQLYLHSENMFVLERNNGVQVADRSFDGGGVTPGVWSHVLVSRSGGRLTQYVNGELKDAFEGPGGFEDVDAAHPLTLGWGSHGGFDGVLDEIRVSRGPRPPGWGRAVYLSQTGEFVNYGVVERRPANEQ